MCIKLLIYLKDNYYLLVKMNYLYLEFINYEISYKHYVLFFVCISFMVVGNTL